MSDEQLEAYFAQLTETKRSGGGKSYGGYMDALAQRVIEQLQPNQRAQLATSVEQLMRVHEEPVSSSQAANFVRSWTIDELERLADHALVDVNLDNGRQAFYKANCVTCHRIQNQGGVQGPDLSTVGSRLSIRDLLTAIAEPSRAISDQYSLYRFELQDGKMIQGRIVDLSEGIWMVSTDMMHPGQREAIQIDDVISVSRLDASAMPEGLCNVLTEAEIRDLLAFLAAQQAGSPNDR